MELYGPQIVEAALILFRRYIDHSKTHPREEFHGPQIAEAAQTLMRQYINPRKREELYWPQLAEAVRTLMRQYINSMKLVPVADGMPRYIQPTNSQTANLLDPGDIVEGATTPALFEHPTTWYEHGGKPINCHHHHYL